MSHETRSGQRGVLAVNSPMNGFSVLLLTPEDWDELKLAWTWQVRPGRRCEHSENLAKGETSIRQENWCQPILHLEPE